MRINIEAITEWVNASPGRDANIVIEEGEARCFLYDKNTMSGAFLDKIGKAPKHMAYPAKKAHGCNHGPEVEELVEFSGANVAHRIMNHGEAVNA